MKPKSIRVAATATLIVALANAVHSAPSESEEIVVTASPLGDILQPSDVLSGEQLLLRSAPTLGETLSAELGVSSTYFEPAASRPVIRGLSGSRVKMLSRRLKTNSQCPHLGAGVQLGQEG